MQTEQSHYSDGISVIICCYNSAERLKPTLAALSQQRLSPSVLLEIILVDNASSDNTGLVALEIWKELTPFSTTSFCLTYEEKPGQNYARAKGVATAKHKFLVFCDDDNWLEESYLQKAYDILVADPGIAACGGIGYPVFETQKPDWFDEYAEAFAVGSQDLVKEGEQILNLYGAGLCLNRKALQKLEIAGFSPQMAGRTGKKLSSSDDTELTYALVLSGQKLVYSEELRFYHFITAERLEWQYLVNLFTAFGKDGPVRNLYYSFASKRKGYRLLRHWPLHLGLSTVRLAKYYLKPPKRGGREPYFQWSLAYIRELFALRKNYSEIRSDIQSLKLRSNTI